MERNKAAVGGFGSLRSDIDHNLRRIAKLERMFAGKGVYPIPTCKQWD